MKPKVKNSTIRQKWYLIDATDKTLGRLASVVAKIIIGKHKPTYAPNVICGDVVVIINCAKIKVTGAKLTDKYYYRHTGYPGGIKEISLKSLLQENPRKVIEHAVVGMLPKNKLRSRMLKNLKIYTGSEHNHEAQKPELIEVET